VPDKVCFIISPFGTEGSATRAKADELLAYVFRPAAQECGYEVIRGDELPRPGLITPQLIDSLLHAELVIADLTGQNPNVIYELGLRHASGRPVIQVTAGDDPLPFDIKDFRTIQISFPGETLGAKPAEEARTAVVRQMQALELPDSSGSNPIADAFIRAGLGDGSQETFHMFPAPRSRTYNHEFYSFFTRQIRAARSAIYITGEGFECADAEGRKVARGFHEAFRVALKNGVDVVRIQTKERASVEWSNMLTELSEAFPDSFNVATLAQRGTAQMSSVCVVDPDDADRCVVEIMLQTEKLFGVRAADLAGTALFVCGRQDLAVDMRNRIVALCRGQQYHNYFAYGSNMDEEQMQRRCPSAERIGIASLRDHELVFNRRGSYRPGGVASAVAARGERVYGVLWRISSSDLEHLDETEDTDAYRRRMETVHGLDGSAWRAFVYEAIPEGEFEPDEGYLELLITSAVKAGLPKPYVDALRKASTDAAHSA
jgi:gamma-glutamylcyclotransferase (GGCT)/AIG2-like uncharacterized protein YtfP